MRQSDWILKTSGDLADWRAAVITGKEEAFNPYKERLSVVGKISPYESYDSILKHLKNQMELEKLSTELSKRFDIQQLVMDIKRELRNLILKHREMFYSNGQFSHCSVQVSLFNDRVRGIEYHMIHVVFHIQKKGHPQESYQWWISCCNPQTIAVGKRTMKLQYDAIIQDYYQWMTADKHLRASDEHGQQWKFYLIKEPVTDEDPAAEVGQLPKERQVLEPVSPAATVDASDGEESEGEKDQGSPD